MKIVFFGLLWLYLVVGKDYPDYCTKTIHSITPIEFPTSWSHGDVQLIQVQVLIRHGARTPWSGPRCWKGYDKIWDCNVKDHVFPGISNSTLPLRLFDKIYDMDENALAGNCMLGGLLDEGYQQQVDNGKMFRNSYVGDDGYHLFTSQEKVYLTNLSSFHLASDDEQRTIMSGQIFMNSMFPQDEKVDHVAVIPWHVEDLKESYYFPNPTKCPRLKDVENSWTSSDTFRQWNNSKSHEELDELIQKGLQEYNPSALFDCVMTSTCTDYPLPDAITSDVFERIFNRTTEKFIQQFLYNSSEFSKLTISPLVQQIRQRIQARINTTAATPEGPKFAMYSGHDTTLAPFLGAVGGEDWLTEFPPYASHVAIELYQGLNHSEDYYVRVLYQGNPLPFQGCDEVLCSLSYFLNATAFVEEDIKICELPLSSSHSTEEYLELLSPKSWLILSVIALTFGLLAGIIIACVVAGRKYRHLHMAKDNENSNRTLLQKDGTPDDMDSSSEIGDDNHITESGPTDNTSGSDNDEEIDLKIAV